MITQRNWSGVAIASNCRVLNKVHVEFNILLNQIRANVGSKQVNMYKMIIFLLRKLASYFPFFSYFDVIEHAWNRFSFGAK